MITAIDTNVLLDVFLADPQFGLASAAAIRSALQQGRIIACEAVWAETCATFDDGSAAVAALQHLGVQFDPIAEAAAVLAGDLWRSYRASGGPRTRVAADFLIGAHARTHADRLLTRDTGFYRDHFGELSILAPA